MTTGITVKNGAVHAGKDKLVKDLNNVVNDAENLIKAVANSTADEFSAARAKVEAKLGDARATLHEARISAAKTACSAANATNVYVRENPWKVVGVAALAGLITALMINRR